MGWMKTDNRVLRNLSVRLIKGGSSRRAAATYTLNSMTDEEWLKLKKWLLGDCSVFSQKAILVVNVLES